MHKLKKKLKGQSGMEFIMLLVFAIGLFLVFYYNISHTNKIAYENKINIIARQISDKAAYEINIAAAQGDGYYKEFYLKNTIYDKTYNISIINNYIFVTWEPIPLNPTSMTSRIITTNIIGNLSANWNYVENSKGIITVGAI
ncbi:MAG: hypothetical protein K0B02_03080 [DPANN group archaeon]|nr:hypothetical protein [DPANN group archaeon]